MFKDIFGALVESVSFFNIFQYITFRAAYAGITAMLVAFVFGPGIIRRLRRLKANQSIREDGPSTHQAKVGTPTMGGIIMILAVVVAVLLWQDIHDLYTWVVLLSMVGFGALGFADDALKIFRKDSKGLQASVKFLGQIILSFIIVLVLFLNQHNDTTMLYLPFIKNPVLDMSVFFIPFGMLVLVSASNAVNLTDGLDGLATGLVLMVVICFGVITYAAGREDWSGYLNIPFIASGGELSVFCLAMAGACVGFLWYNTHPAEIMMGDTGSLALGGTIGTVSLIIKKEILLVIVGAVFALEALSVIMQVLYFKKTGKRIFKMAPLHHHFELSGWKESKVVVRFWILGGLFCVLALSTLKIQ